LRYNLVLYIYLRGFKSTSILGGRMKLYAVSFFLCCWGFLVKEEFVLKADIEMNETLE